MIKNLHFLKLFSDIAQLQSVSKCSKHWQLFHIQKVDKKASVILKKSFIFIFFNSIYLSVSALTTSFDLMLKKTDFFSSEALEDFTRNVKIEPQASFSLATSASFSLGTIKDITAVIPDPSADILVSSIPVKIQCFEGDVIKIHHADFGLSNEDYCPYSLTRYNVDSFMCTETETSTKIVQKRWILKMLI